MLISAHPTTPRSVTVLGSTGSIGCSTIDLLQRNPEAFKVVALVGGRQVEKLAEQARQLRPEIAVIADESKYDQLKQALAGTDIEVAAGQQAVIEAAERPVDWVMAAIIGAAGLAPTLAAARKGAIIALANKEALVCSGKLFQAVIQENNGTLLPVDSEHNAIYQVFDGARDKTIRKIILTASGGPFRRSSLEEMRHVTPEQAVAHPNWSMGAKISVDSSTMMNKGLEMIEAHFLFNLPEEQIDVVVHPQSIIHSMVDYVDGSVLAQLGCPDMRTPIAYSLAWPDRMVTPVEQLDLAKIAELTFEAPDLERFKALSLARLALREGKSAPCVFNAANEVAVSAFFDRKIGYLDIADLVETVLQRTDFIEVMDLETVYDIDRETRRHATEILKEFAQ